MNLSLLKNDLPKRAMLAVLVLGLVAGVVTGRERPAAVAPQSAQRVPAKAEAADIDLSRLERRMAQAPQTDPFARRSFAAGAPQAAGAPAQPVAPPLPFRYLGRLTENGNTEVFLLRGEDILSVAPGRNIDAEYRVEAITDSAISVTYLPLHMRQSLELAP